MRTVDTGLVESVARSVGAHAAAACSPATLSGEARAAPDAYQVVHQRRFGDAPAGRAPPQRSTTPSLVRTRGGGAYMPVFGLDSNYFTPRSEGGPELLATLHDKENVVRQHSCLLGGVREAEHWVYSLRVPQIELVNARPPKNLVEANRKRLDAEFLKQYPVPRLH